MDTIALLWFHYNFTLLWQLRPCSRSSFDLNLLCAHPNRKLDILTTYVLLSCKETDNYSIFVTAVLRYDTKLSLPFRACPQPLGLKHIQSFHSKVSCLFHCARMLRVYSIIMTLKIAGHFGKTNKYVNPETAHENASSLVALFTKSITLCATTVSLTCSMRDEKHNNLWYRNINIFLFQTTKGWWKREHTHYSIWSGIYTFVSYKAG